MALADEVAAASGLAMGKAARVPVAIVRGVELDAGSGTGGRHRPAAGGGPVPRRPRSCRSRSAANDPRVRARATCARGGGGGRPRRVHRAGAASHATVVVHARSGPRRPSGGSLGAIADAWREDLRRDGDARGHDRTPDRQERRGARRRARPDRPVGPVRAARTPTPTTSGRTPSGRCSCSSGGAAIQNLLLALHAQGLASCWISLDAVLPGGESRGARDVATSGSRSGPSRWARCRRGPRRRGPRSTSPSTCGPSEPARSLGLAPPRARSTRRRSRPRRTGAGGPPATCRAAPRSRRRRGTPRPTPLVMLYVKGIITIVSSAGIPIPGSDHEMSLTSTIMK